LELCALGAGDLNGDGRSELVGGTGAGLRVLLGQEDGGLVRGSDYTSSASCTLALGDMNGDGKLDVVTAQWGPEHGQVSLLFGEGDGTFRP
jgi:hypothetical protein